MGIINYLKQPFPKAENKWRIIIFMSLFVALFLIIFQPFDINLYRGSNKFIVLSGYGLITFLILVLDMIILENIFKKFYNEQSWTIWKEFVSLFWIIFTIGLGNALYTSIVFGFYFKSGLEFYINFQLITMVVGIIPITILIVSKQKYLLRKHLLSANELNKSIEIEAKPRSKNRLIRFFADNEKDFVEFDINDFFFIESSGNYIEIYIKADGKIVRKTFRSTLKRALDFFKDTREVMQCHRAFIVNSKKIVRTYGNSQGLRLELENCEIEVPVSRGFVNSIKGIIN